ncbi:Fructosamine-3-kinase [Palleronia marisminoris]|uniref:Fructosamine kinase n=1 Tax=Palleronia marisminoris TaxID=315423 RepID=A0A1Y5RJ18_9RHOB|nr:fructosamine kinase family protein [Palleronia marisminoris]SFG24139.1 Fructosamine-3-kinase [Palleronia marisminoris]SLN18742.1 Fructosamine kinase [Palleronia marisminoris]
MSDFDQRISALVGQPVRASRRLSGGDVSSVRAVTLDDGRTLVAKVGGPVRNEARMLSAIAAAGCPAAQVIAVDEQYLVMTMLSEGRPSETGWAEAGRAIAKLHAASGAHYGWPEDHAIGAAIQPGGKDEDWPRFWAEARLLAWPEALTGDVAKRLETLAGRLPDLLPARPPASLLHGDLWTGNLIFDGGFQGLIDPASYYGDAEVDLAALTTFGTPPDSFWESYGPLRDGWEERRPVYRLWIALLHLRLFGASYRGMVEGCLDRAGA